MLTFSDSRQEAARLGPRLTHQHEIQLIRAAMTQGIAASPVVNPAVLQHRRNRISELEECLRNPDLSEPERAMFQDDLQNVRSRLEHALQGGSLSSWLCALAESQVSRSFWEQLLDFETSRRHDPKTWDQRAWETNRKRVLERLETLVGQELARPNQRSFSLQTLGLAEITYPGLEQLSAPRDLLGELPTAAAREQLGACWTDLLAALCDSLRSDGAVTLGSDALDNEYQFGPVLIGRWCTEERDDGWNLIRMVGATSRQRRRLFAERVLRAARVAQEAETLSPTVLRTAFQQLKENAGHRLPWLDTDKRQSLSGPVEAIRIVFPKLALRRPLQLYRSRTTGHLWPRSILGCAPEFGSADLEPVDSQVVDSDPRISRQRRELQKSRVFSMGLWAEEHSAQLAPLENRRLQDLFKLGVRNILSSTTTLELGIDIGGLSAVLMSNVPPGQANYLQRAGRAGRRSDGSSVVLTFARPRPFDREVFRDFGKYMNRRLRRPRVFLERKRVARRHVHSFLLGEFFRSVYPPDRHVGAMRAFGFMGGFCGVPLPPRWEGGQDKPAVPFLQPDWVAPVQAAWWKTRQDQGLESHFRDYLEWIKEYQELNIRPCLEALLDNATLIDDLNDWGTFFNTTIESLSKVVDAWRRDYDSLLESWHAVDPQAPCARTQANALRYQLSALFETTVIESLADQQFLPRYGFPIGMLRLRVIQPDEKRPGRVREEDQYRLERSGLLALREYVPGSQLLVGGRLITSRGLMKHWTGANLDNYLGLRGQLARCKNGHLYYDTTGGGSLGDCPICGSRSGQPPEPLLLPRHGFSSAAWEPPKASTDIEYIGRVERATITFSRPTDPGTTELKASDFGGARELRARYREDGELLVYNRGENSLGFAICLKCGYAESEPKLVSVGRKRSKGAIDLPVSFLFHAPLTSPDHRKTCRSQNETGSLLRHQVLAARETTDVLLLDFSGCLPLGQDNEAILETLAKGLHIAGAKILELDSRELGSLVVPGQGSDVVLYDNVPGGAGHVRELFGMASDWLRATLNTLWVDPLHHARCETACLDCLLTFDAQEAMSQGLLRRRLAYQELNRMMGGIHQPEV